MQYILLFEAYIVCSIYYFSKPIYYVFIGFLVSAFSYFIWDEIYRFIFADILFTCPNYP